VQVLNSHEFHLSFVEKKEKKLTKHGGEAVNREESPLCAPLGCLSEMTSRLRFDSSKYSKKHSAEVDIGGKNTE